MKKQKKTKKGSMKSINIRLVPKKIKNKKQNMTDFEQNLKMMEYLQKEYLHLHDHFWSLLIKIFIITIVIAIIPLTENIMGISVVKLGKNIELMFPMASLVLSLYGTIILNSKEKEIISLKQQISNINKKMKAEYQFEFDEIQNQVEKTMNNKKKFFKNLLKYKATSMAYVFEYLVTFWSLIVIMAQ